LGRKTLGIFEPIAFNQTKQALLTLSPEEIEQVHQGISRRKSCARRREATSGAVSSVAKSYGWPGLIEKYEREMFSRARIAVQESENAAAYFCNLHTHS
jgi:hypothetical protein